ncbi:protein giant-lens [Centruroides vittatus]|uniref:protein giant-lens-like n=1 Tax=Centruroides sculpturatus TaxID=218467 RepID=UPI000C6CB0B0|nr:protein giant-lens-like [Centruroides sculpturatus]
MSRRATVSVLKEREKSYVGFAAMETRFVASCLIVLFLTGRPSLCGRLMANFRHKVAYRIYYQNGNADDDLPECAPWSVCNRVDTYSTPWVEKQCRCPGKHTCSMSIDARDGHTVVDKSRQFKICENVVKLPACRYFRDVTWSYSTRPDNTTQQVMHCLCPKNSVAYIFKHQAFQTIDGYGYRYLFACSPQSRLRCQRKEPCRLFTVKKRPDVEEVNTNTLCQCPHGYTCPQHHTEPSVITGTSYPQEHIRTYSGYCAPQYL